MDPQTEAEQIAQEVDLATLQCEIDQLSKEIKLKTVRDEFSKWLYLPQMDVLDVILATCCSVRYTDDPLWLFLVGPPSSGKTELLRAMYAQDNIIVDSLTAHTLVSGLRRVTAADPSLFSRINNKTLVIKDFTNILSLQREDASLIYAQLRNAYDGYYTFSCGTFSPPVTYLTHFALCAGVTSIIDHHWSVRRMLGERFLYWRLPLVDEIELSKAMLKNRQRYPQMRRQLMIHAGAFLQKYKDLVNKVARPQRSEEMTKQLTELAIMATKLRSPVYRDEYTREIMDYPEKEGLLRLLGQLCLLGEALCLIREKTVFGPDEYKILYKTAVDTIPPSRWALIKELAVGSLSVTSELAERVDLPTTTCRRNLEDLTALHVCQRFGDNPHQWCLDEEFLNYYEATKPEQAKNVASL